MGGHFILSNTYEKDYTAPGSKNVTCLVTYLCSVDINGSNYDFTFGNEAVASVLVKGPAVAVKQIMFKLS